MTQTILLVFGTRPEAIKMLPVARALADEPGIKTRICVTAQHRQMLDQVLALFETRPDFDLDIMTEAQGLDQITTAVLQGLSRVIDAAKPDRILVHGDTTTTMAASIAAFYKNVPVAHVEAGLRSGDPQQPWPEEMNRRVTDVIADLFFAPTARSRDNLLREGVRAEAIHVTGNTVIDALLETATHIERKPALAAELAQKFAFLDPALPILLVTGHRRENFGAPFLSLCGAIRDLVRAHPIQAVYPVHLNPKVQSAVRQVLDGVSQAHLIEPLDYLPFVYLMKRSYVILTDSGGIQEEGPLFGKPVFVMRNVTERPEAVEAGTVKLVGTDSDRIFAQVSDVITDPAAYDRMSRAHNPYGDGRAGRRIAAILAQRSTDEFKP
jgi:UDP-N-acetylglucosamine 2-epimerase (non-hydrolysing)